MDKLLWLVIGAVAGYWYANNQQQLAAGQQPTPLPLPGGFSLNPPSLTTGGQNYPTTPVRPPYTSWQNPIPGVPIVN